MGFEACHPAVNLIYFAAVIFGMLAFQHPVFLAISFLCAFAYSLKRNGTKALMFNLCLIPCIAVFALYYSSLHHFGMTVLRQNFIGNNMTVESLVYGIVLGVSLAGVMIWMSCVYSVFSSDKVVYLFGKASPRLSLFLAILLRMVPRIKGEAKRIHTARKGLGKGIDAPQQHNSPERRKLTEAEVADAAEHKTQRDHFPGCIPVTQYSAEESTAGIDHRKDTAQHTDLLHTQQRGILQPGGCHGKVQPGDVNAGVGDEAKVKNKIGRLILRFHNSLQRKRFPKYYHSHFPLSRKGWII